MSPARPSPPPSSSPFPLQDLAARLREIIPQQDHANPGPDNSAPRPRRSHVRNDEEEHIARHHNPIMRTLRWRRASTRSRRDSRSEFSRVLIKPSDCSDKLPICWPKKDKWYILCVIFLVQVSMNLNTTLYSNGIAGIAEEYGLSYFQVRWGGAASFLIAYAFGCELWAPWSEEYGRRNVLQASLFLVNMWAILVGISPTWYGHVIGRTLGGLSSAGGSVTLALITDMFDPHSAEHQHATGFIVFSSVGGSILGPIFGGIIEAYLSWRWVIWIQVIFGIMVQLLHYFVVPETRTTIVMDRAAREMRESGVNPSLYGPNEISGDRRINWSEVWKIWLRPFKMFFTEPIVLVFSLLSGFSDAIIFMMVQSFGFVYWQWGFGPILLGCTFLPIGIGYMIGYALAYYFIGRQIALRERKPLCERAQYEARLFWLLFAAPLLPLGLLLFAFTAAYTQPPLHWIFSMIASCMIGIANFAIYMGTIDYVLRAYGPYAASATGGNGWARDFLAGVLTPYAVPMYVPLAPYETMTIFTGTLVLASIGAVLFLSLIVVYIYGHWLRRWSKFAQTLAEAEAEAEAEVGIEINVDAPDLDLGSPSGVTTRINDENPNLDLLSVDRIVHFLPPESLPGSRAGSRYPSAANTPTTTRPSSLDVDRLAMSQLHGPHLNLHSQVRPVSAPVRSQNVSPVPEATSSDDVSLTCSNCSGQTLAGTCTQCTHKSTRSPNGENVSPSTSLREVENAELSTVPEVSPVVAPPSEKPDETPAADLPKEKKRRFSGTCRMM